MSDGERDYYCSYKFKFLKVDLENIDTYNCDAARPHRIDKIWLKNNPGQLFNTDVNVAERQLMLQNLPNHSCEQNCYRAESVGAVGPRILRKGFDKTHTEIRLQPEIVDFTLSSECNMSCSYCSKVYSKNWRDDILKNGDYVGIDDNGNRYTLTPRDLVLSKTSQPNRSKAESQQLLLKELELVSGSLKQLIITGGEPLLHNQLEHVLELAKQVPSVKVFSGLGMSMSRFTRMANMISRYPNTFVCVSAENTGGFYNFNRYGAQWENFVSKIKVLEDCGVNFKFHLTLTSLTMFDAHNFIKKFHDYPLEFDLAYTPDFMAVYVIDEASKQHILDAWRNIDIDISKDLIKSLQIKPTQQQRQRLASFLRQFVSRRPDLNLDIFPKSFIDWLELTHVVQ